MKRLKKRFTIIALLFFVLVYNLSTYVYTFSEHVSKIATSETGIKNNIVTINEMDKDYDYYMGLNYVSNDGTLPTTQNKNLYNEKNLIELKITYYGIDISGKNKGYVSTSEQQDTFIYYKMYVVNDNGTTNKNDDYVEIELIDNPFTDRPNDKGFNGWTTDYPNAIIKLDNNYYVRYVKVPVTYKNNEPEPININFYANWINAKVSYINTNTTWTSAFNSLDHGQMQPIGGEIPVYESITGLYLRYTLSFGSSYPNGAVNENGGNASGWCTNFFNGCTYYLKVEEETKYDSSLTYYKLNNNTMTEYDVSITSYEKLPYLENGTILSGYYKQVNLINSNIAGYYSSDGTIQNNEVCTSNCTYYELINYYDENGNINKADGNTLYYYLATRDTNIIVMDESVSTKWTTTETKPFTLTSIHNGTDYTNNVTWNVSNQYITCYADTTIENIKINSNENNSSNDPSSSTTATRYIYANYNNLKIGRGIVQYNSYKTFNGIYGGNNNTDAIGNANNVIKYKLIVESGFYNTITLTNGPSNTSRNKYIEAKGVYGSDYDKVSNKDNLDVYFEVVGSWGAGNYYASTTTGITFDTVIKSGKYGTGKSDHTTGVYVGGRSYGTHYTARRIKVEGGWIYNLIGGPLTANNRGNLNDTYIYITGGTVDMVVGGAGTSTTYGNRIISVTGGTINYSIFGGSNSYSGDSSDGKLTGSSFVYVGGQAIIGNQDYINSNTTLWGAESGSVFGIGNGNNSSSSIGTNENSNIIIDGNCKILGNVYGGGNYSATGIDSTKSETITNIKMLGGTVDGSIYGGGNNNGSGSTTIPSTINIEILNGTVNGSIYGGAKTTGTIYGNIKLNISGGTFNNSIYGGGQGSSTYVSQNIDIIVGNNDISNYPILENNLYGGSEFGTVNGTSQSTNYETNITINNGIIKGSVFGGAKGNDIYTPNILGDVKVVVNGGKINNIFGANDNSGTLLETTKIYLNGGEITSVYGGGNKTSQDITNVYLQGSQVGSLFGGSNELGNVETSNITVTGGTAITIYGGNNVGGKTNISNINLNGGKITSVYGGGNKTALTTSNIIQTGTEVESIYGGSNELGNVETSNVTITGGQTKTIYGGNNQGGETNKSYIKASNGIIETIYGGGKLTNTITTNIDINGAEVESIYGGGENASASTTNVTIKKGTIINIFGGSNNSGDVNLANIDIYDGTISNLYGGNNTGGETKSTILTIEGANINNLYGGGNNTPTTMTNININAGIVENTYGGGNDTKGITTTTNLNLNGGNITNIYGGGNKANTTTSNINLNGSSIINLYGGGNQSGINDSNINLYYGTVENVFGGSNISGNVNSTNIIANKKESTANLKVINLYGGNNQGGITDNATITLNNGEYDNVYGGGNQAISNKPVVNIQNININENVYGGGNQSLVTDNTNLNIKDSIVNGSVFGGGNSGAIGKDTNIYISNSKILGSIYGGGNGTTAIVSGNTNLDIDGTTVISKHVFGGGNAANTGLEVLNNSKTTVNIAGAIIDGNIYGGGNTSIVYGTTNLNIGNTTLKNKNLIKNNINIKGTVFGGGEANEQGSEIYDYSFISVTNGTNVNINGMDHDQFKINGSIFGSGNASSTEGYSYINIANYGTEEIYNKNISIQRADMVIIDNSVIELIGATDRTNEYSTVEFSLSRIKHLKLKNNSILYLNTGANLLEEYTSAIDILGKETLENISIEDNKVIKNVDNKIFIKGGKNLNIATTENATTYGRVNGMTFFGLYTKDRNDKILTGIYDNYQIGDKVDSNDAYLFDSGSYVLGIHKPNHNIEIDGFYTNYVNDEIISTDYIKPTPDNSTYYMWSIGEKVVTIEISLTASKYLTLGAEELGMLNYSDPNTTFSIVGFNYNNLDPNINLVEESAVPRIANTKEEADNNMSLVMKPTNSGWITKGETTFVTKDDGILGTTFYKSENSTDIPSFQFYIYHSKNLGTSGEMGSVTISFVVSTPIDNISNKVQRVNLIVNLDRKLYNTNDYEAAMTNGKEYDLFASTNVNLTTDGSFSAYYSLFTQDEDFLYKEGYHRSLVSTYAFPINTKLTLINLNEDNVNEYYYYVVNENDYNESLNEIKQDKECTYDFSKFIRMGSTSSDNNFNDEINNLKYYNSTTGISHEEFIVIVDFADSNITKNILNQSLLIELRNADNKTVVSVLGIEQENMIYSLYTNSRAVIDVEGTLSSSSVYPGKSVSLNVTTNFKRQIIDSKIIYDTNYFDQQLGVKISYLDSNNNPVTGASLLGVTYEYEGVIYYPRMDGSVRIRLAEKMANVSSNIIINTTESVAAGDYTMVIESFGSSDGIYYGGVSSDTDKKSINILNTVYGLSLTMGDYLIIRDKETGNNLNNNNDLRFNLKYSSGLLNPKLRISLYRRNYDSIYSTNYEIVDLQEYVNDSLTKTKKQYEYLLADTPLSDITYSYKLKDSLKTGTYKLVISLYDNNTYIGDVYKYLIIKERYNE